MKKRMKKQQAYKHSSITHAIVTALFLALTLPSMAQREKQSINDSWRFLKGECATASDSIFDDSGWTKINLPHTWNADAYATQDYYRGIGWYRRLLTLPPQWQGKQIFLNIGAASKAATVFINGRNIGEHAGGYTAFTFDITPYISFHSPNVLAIRVDNARMDIPPISGDFTFFGGIYRDVWLTAVPSQHICQTNLGSSGIFIDTPLVSDKQATLSIRGKIENNSSKRTNLELISSIYQPDGTLFQTITKNISIKPKENYAFQQNASVPHPQLWSPETPNLYRIEITLYDKKTKTILDQSNHNTGFRWFHFDADKGFFLNGKPYKLRGVCRHQDQKPIGVALTDEMHRRDMKLIKDMGANFIRISHYPQDDAILEMCDKLGILAWEEIPIIDIIPDTPDYTSNCEHNLREMIRQHYNHPSIIMWGYMNEILLVTQRKYTTETELKSATERTLSLAKRLEIVLKEEDRTRVSTMAFHGSNSYNETGLGNITDVVGWNLYQGWYGGDLTEFEKFLEEQHKNYPAHPIIVSEYGAGSDHRLNSLTPHAFDFSIEYQQKYLEHYLPVLENTPYICGGSHWNFIDFSSAARNESMPHINNKGLTYADRTPKDVYYYYQATWKKDAPILHIASRDWNRRSGVRQENQPVVQPVKIYTNLSEIELIIDGQSIGKQKVENYTTEFNVPFRKKKTFIIAQGSYKGKTVQDALNIDFLFIPDKLNSTNTKELELAINTGSQCFFTSDESNLTWIPDRPYTPGGWGYIGGKEQSTQTEISSTADNPLFQTLRNDISGYRFDTPKGTYEVELSFADIDQQNISTAYLLGHGENQTDRENIFNIFANGNILEEKFSPAKACGYFHLLRKKYIISSQTNYLEIRFQPINGKCFLNSIKLRRIY